MLEVLLFVLLFLLGIVAGCIFTRLVLKSKHAGTLYVYDSEPDENPSLFLELDTKVETVTDSKYVTFEVKKLHTQN